MDCHLLSRRYFFQAALAAMLLLPALAAHGQDTFDGVDRIVAVGDVHGGFEEFVGVLRAAGLIDRDNSWSGGTTHLVQTGDILDRGADSRKVMDLLMSLEEQAVRAGGRVHVLLGNHECMNLTGDLRYVSEGEFKAFRTPKSEGARKQAFESQATEEQRKDRELRRQWEQQHPLGWIEHRLAFSGAGQYGRWLQSKNCVIRINQVLFVHGGISPKYSSMSIREINDRLRADLKKPPDQLQDPIFTDPVGPLWYRGMAQAPEDELAAHVDAVLAAFGVRHVVVAHTPTPGVVVPRFGGKVIVIDVGLSQTYGGSPACLIFEGPKPYALHRGHKLELPIGEDIMGYLKTAASYDPSNSLLQRWLSRLSRRGLESAPREQ